MTLVVTLSKANLSQYINGRNVHKMNGYVQVTSSQQAVR